METTSSQPEGYGLCPENPVRLTDIPLEYLYLSKLISPAGTPFVPSGRCFVTVGMVDGHDGYYRDASGRKVEVVIYLHAYNEENDIRPPDGWSMSEIDIDEANA